MGAAYCGLGGKPGGCGDCGDLTPLRGVELGGDLPKDGDEGGSDGGEGEVFTGDSPLGGELAGFFFLCSISVIFLPAML